MPANVVKTPEDERLWDKAKELAKEQGHTEDWPYVMGIFQKMKGNKSASLAERVASRFAAKAPDYGRAASEVEKVYKAVQAMADTLGDYEAKIDQLPQDAEDWLPENHKKSMTAMRGGIKLRLEVAREKLEASYMDFRELIKFFDALG